MNKILKEEIVAENGMEYKVTYFTKDGENITGILKRVNGTDNAPKNRLTEEQQTIFDMAMNIEYLVCIQELGI